MHPQTSVDSCKPKNNNNNKIDALFLNKEATQMSYLREEREIFKGERKHIFQIVVQKFTRASQADQTTQINRTPLRVNRITICTYLIALNRP